MTKTTKEPSTVAQCATAVREELKNYPGIKFSVTSENYSGGDSVNIKWYDGPTEKEVMALIGKYQAGHFNGMEDIYEYSNSRNDIAQTKFLFANRKMSEPTKAVLQSAMDRLWPQEQGEFNVPEQNLYRIWQKSSLPVGAVVTGIESNGFGSGLIENMYQITFEGAQAPNAEPVKEEKTDGRVQIIDYSLKAIAVVGDTRPIKDLLKELGGRFNARLTCGAGWIFPKTQQGRIITALKASAARRKATFDGIQEEIKKIEEMSTPDPDVKEFEGTEGQDREGYTDEQDREDYTAPQAVMQVNRTVTTQVPAIWSKHGQEPAALKLYSEHGQGVNTGRATQLTLL